MNQPSNERAVSSRRLRPDWLPAPGVRWAMRLLAGVCLLMAAGLAGVNLAMRLGWGEATVPLCGGGWLDCGAVLDSRYASWFGVPVALFGAATYLAVLVGLGALGPRRSERTARRIWWVLSALAASIALAAAWFIYLQAAVLDAWCAWCTATHALGLPLAALIGLRASGAIRPVRHGAAPLGLALGVALIVGQWLHVPRYTEPIVWRSEGDRYIESTDAGRAISLLDGRIVLNAEAHPILGVERAEHFAIEIVDYNCGGCRRLTESLKAARPLLGPEIAVLVVAYPIDAECNDAYSVTPTGYENSCELARLALAVWLTDRTAYEPFHHWLFERQNGLTLDEARREAERRVGGGALADALADPRLARMLRRDIALADRLLRARDDGQVGGLPGLIAGDRFFRAYPVDPAELARALRAGFEPGEPDEAGP